MIRGKRGQIFLIGAIIFVFALYTLVIPYNTIKTYPGLDDYKDLSENYQAEFPRVYNWALYKGENVETSLEQFNSAFTEQAGNVDPNFGVFYAFVDSNGRVNIVNTLNNKAIVVSYEDPVTLEQLQFNLVDAESTGQICVEGIGCSSASARTSDFDRSYVGTSIENPGSLTVQIAGEETIMVIDLDRFSTLTCTRSEASIIPEDRITAPGGDYENIEISCQQY